jgi:hypothetical protein
LEAHQQTLLVASQRAQSAASRKSARGNVGNAPVSFFGLVVAAKLDTVRLPAAALLNARNVRRDRSKRVDMLSPQGGWRWQLVGFSRL